MIPAPHPAVQDARDYLAEVLPDRKDLLSFEATSLRAAVNFANHVPDLVASDPEWALQRTPIEVARLLELADACDGRPKLREPILRIVDAEVETFAKLRTAAGYPAPVRWGEQHVHPTGLVALMVDWVGWLLRLDHPEELSGWDEFIETLGYVRGSTWVIVGAHDELPRILPAPNAAEVAGVSERTLRRWAKAGKVRRHRAEYRDLIVTGFDEVEVAAVKNPRIGAKPQVKGGVSA